jgi:hypothetical protein
MRPLLAGQENNSGPRSSNDELPAHVLLSNGRVAQRSSNSNANADKLPRDSAHLSGKLPSSDARQSSSALMSEDSKLTDRGH